MITYIVDTCVWRDFYEDRVSKYGSPIGKYASDFFARVIKNKKIILFSEGLLRELFSDYDKDEINEMLNMLMILKILIKIDISKEEFLESKKLSAQRNLPFIDCLNAVQARNYDAILVTRDAHFFKNLKDITIAVRPEDTI